MTVPHFGRRQILLALLASPTARAASGDETDAPRFGRSLQFPRDHGAHLQARTEWWYATGWLDAGGALWGFQVTFFRQRTGLAESLPGRFAPRQLLFAHAAVSDPAAARHRRAQRIARWAESPDAPEGHASGRDTEVALGRWFLRRDGAGYRTGIDAGAAAFAFELALHPTQPVLLHGDRGSVRKGPRPEEFGHYLTEPQLAVQGELRIDGRRLAVQGRAWLDHEWSDTPLPAGAVGWDWIGINFDDGSVLMAIRMRSAAGAAVWAGGSFRRPGGETLAFGPDEVRFEPGRRWISPETRAAYPIQWRIGTPVGTFELRALFDAQELDSRASTGAVYWEGLAELADSRGRRLGRGYLEMTGYVEPLRLG